ncbi:MAG: alpha-amylase family glycosyl hydrolase, partial [Planctomycetota bacterium]
PVHQFPGGRNWGYDGVHAFAVQNTYGGPRALQRLVDAAHREGLAVVLDVVYNHFGPEGNYLGKFGPYFSDRYHTPWGSAVNFDTPGSDPVRWHFIDNALYWVRHFHVDGLRLDATHEIYDHGPLHILEELQAAVQREAGRRQWPVHVVAESDRNDPRLIRAAEQGGYALDGTWSDDFHHAVHALLTGDRTVYYRDFGSLDQLAKGFRDAFVFDGQFSEYRGRRQGRPVGDLDRRKFVVCVQNHDQVGNRPQGDRLSQMLPPAALRLACGVMLISPYVPLLFMGEEYGEQRPFPFFCSFLDRHLVRAVRRGRRAGFAGELRVPDPQAERTFRSAVLTWQWPEGSWQAAIRRLYCDLLRARRRWDALRDRGPARSRLLAADGNQPCLMVERGAEGALLAVANCSAVELPLPSIGGNRPPLRLSTESACYGGTRSDGDDPRTLLPYEMLIYGVEEVPR